MSQSVRLAPGGKTHSPRGVRTNKTSQKNMTGKLGSREGAGGARVCFSEGQSACNQFREKGSDQPLNRM